LERRNGSSLEFINPLEFTYGGREGEREGEKEREREREREIRGAPLECGGPRTRAATLPPTMHPLKNLKLTSVSA
jgi:hypothetical protein